MESEKIIGVTGATGFVGRNLTPTLKEAGFSTRALVRDAKSRSGAESQITGNLETGEGLDEFMKGVDVVINLVGGFQPPFRGQVIGNVITLDNLCSSAIRNGVKKIIHISALAVYGIPENGHLFVEEDNPKPDTTYALAKEMTEEVAEFYHRNYGLSFVVLRPPNVYGPGSDHGAVYNLIESAKETGGVTIHGDGTQQRDFLYVGDLVDAIIKSIKFGNSYDVLNITTGDPKDLNQLVTTIGKVMGIDLKIIYEGEAQGARIIAGDFSKAKKLLKWEPKTSLESGLALTVNQ